MEPSRRKPPPPLPPLNGRPEGAHLDPAAVVGPARPGEERCTVPAGEVPVTGILPAIAEPPPCVADRHRAVDRVPFAIAAAMALGFVAWASSAPPGSAP